MLERTEVAGLADRLYHAQVARDPIETLNRDDGSPSVEDAYAIQAALVARLSEDRGPQLGWKVGATNQAVQSLLSTPEPFYGCLLSGNRLSSGARLSMSDLISPLLECEVAIELGADLAGPGITAEAAGTAVARIMPSFEVVDPRTREWKTGPVNAIADNALQTRFVLGPPVTYDTAIDLSQVRVTLTRGDEVVAEGDGTNVLGNPLNVLAWLANALPNRGHMLRAGDLVMTGTITPVVALSAGDAMTAAFEIPGGLNLGAVSAQFV